MTLAALQNAGVRSLAALVVFGWSGAALAQPAPPASPTASPPTTSPPAAKPPAAAGTKAPAPRAAQPPNGSAAAAKGTTAPAAAAPNKVSVPNAAGTAPAPPNKVPAAPPSNTAAATPPRAAGATAAPNAAATPSTAPATATGNSTGTAPGTTGAGAATSGGEPWVAAPAGQASSPASTGSTTAVADDGSAPPPVYYVEPAPAPDASRDAPTAQREPEPIRMHIEEPPPPPVPRHVAPRTALWLGARVGYFIPFGDLWGRCASAGYGPCDGMEGAKFSDVAASGPMFELDVGARVGRNYVIYLGWERAQLGGADGPSPASGVGKQLRGESDFIAVGVRLSADPDDIGLLLDLSIGARRFRGIYDGDTQLQLTNAPMESRLGIGVDIRTNRSFSLSPMLTLGLGSFGKADWVTPGQVQTAIPADSDRLTHGWLTLQLGGHFDIAGSR